MENTQTDLDNLTPLLKRKYVTILFGLGIFILLTPSYITHVGLLVGVEGIAIFMALCVWGLHRGFWFQKIARPLRPFIMARILQILSCLLTVAIITITSREAMNQIVPFVVYWLISIFISLQFFQIFSLAREAKKQYPDRCEFC